MTIELTEREFDQQITDLATTLGYMRYHTYRSKHSPAGFPDLVLVRERVIFAELKSEKGQPTSDQQHWLDKLKAAGAEVYLWRPSDLPGIMDILRRRQPHG